LIATSTTSIISAHP